MTIPGQNAARDLGAAFMDLNPHLKPGECGPGAEGGVACCGDGAQALRVVSAGGKFVESILPEVFTPMEQLWRKLPDEGIFTASPSNPSVIEIGAFRVPGNMALILGEYVLQPFRFNGQLANDLLPLEQQRMATTLGYDVNFSHFRKGNLRFEIIPTNAPANSREAFQDPNPFRVIFQGTTVEFPMGPIEDLYDETPAPPPPADVLFNQARSGVRSAASGSSLIPPTDRVGQGPASFPFTYIVESNDFVQIRVTIFQPVSIPIAFFQASISGYLVSSPQLEQLKRRIAPCW